MIRNKYHIILAHNSAVYTSCSHLCMFLLVKGHISHLHFVHRYLPILVSEKKNLYQSTVSCLYYSQVIGIVRSILLLYFYLHSNHCLPTWKLKWIPTYLDQCNILCMIFNYIINNNIYLIVWQSSGWVSNRK